MHVDLSLNPAVLYSFLLVLARVSGVVAFTPMPGFSAGAPASRAGLAVALTAVLFPVWPVVPASTVSVGRFLGWIGAEAALGLTVGVAVSFLLEGVQMAAQLIGLQAGYSYASTVDPSTQADTTTLQLMMQLFAGSLFFSLGFDRQVVQVLARSLQSIPAGDYTVNGTVVQAITRLGSGIFSTGVQLAIPVLGLLLLLEIAFAVLGRLQTQLQLLSLSFLAKMLVAVAFLAGIVSFFPSVFERAGSMTMVTLLRLLGS